MKQAERNEASSKVALLISELFSEHKAQCQLDPCVTTERMEEAFLALDKLRRGR
jgi:hypothetical protein